MYALLYASRSGASQHIRKWKGHCNRERQTIDSLTGACTHLSAFGCKLSEFLPGVRTSALHAPCAEAPAEVVGTAGSSCTDRGAGQARSPAFTNTVVILLLWLSTLQQV